MPLICFGCDRCAPTARIPSGCCLQAKTMVPGTPDWKATIQPTLCAIIVLYLLKLVQQAYLDSLPLFTSRLYGWTAGEAGLLLAAFGIR